MRRKDYHAAMDRIELLQAVGEVARQAGAPGDPEDHLDQLLEYMAQMGQIPSVDDYDPDVVFATARSLLQGQTRMQVQREQVKTPMGTWRLAGVLEPAVCLTIRRRGMAPGDFKRAFPTIWPKIGAAVGGKKISPGLLAGAIRRPYRVVHQDWTSDERLSSSPAELLILGVSFDDLGLSTSQRSVAGYIERSSEQSGHPVLGLPGTATVGWVRLVRDGDVLLVEEIQSDWFAALKQLGDVPRAMRRGLPFDYDATLGAVRHVVPTRQPASRSSRGRVPVRLRVRQQGR